MIGGREAGVLFLFKEDILPMPMKLGYLEMRREREMMGRDDIWWVPTGSLCSHLFTGRSSNLHRTSNLIDMIKSALLYNEWMG